MEKKIDFDVCVVLPASGIGGRMCISQPKQYCRILNKPLLLFSVEIFHNVEWIKHIIVTVDKSYLKVVNELIKDHGFNKVSVVEGGATRHRSIYSGIKTISEVCPLVDVVLIHDAVRPLVDEAIIKAVTNAARTHGAAGVVRPLVSTVISIDSDGFLKESLNRSQFRASEMPQGFQYDVIKTAYEKSSDHDLDYGTECLQLALLHTGTKARLVDGPDSLWKITYKKDLYAADGMLKEKFLHAGVIGDSSNVDVIAQLCSHLKNYHLQVTAVKTLSDLPGFTTDIIQFQTVTSTDVAQSQLSCVPGIMSHLSSLTASPLISTPVIVFVFCCCKTVDMYQVQTVLLKKFRTEKNGQLGAQISCVVTEENPDVTKLSELLRSIVWNRWDPYSRQVFMI